ncbi:hypothetical protein [Paenibacillus arenilitoris]|uniref:Zinc-finger domain-containing protein n=1 Tax=Paenibacillus arenilitoris TaxID=2772299 RepID=A0A927H9H9_9BACL|nr:hypothetical protein [Paenibacillus arenilitoris]MBD2871624.1 hypothetical protein [Paenibacillus arenilitoris]
MSEGIKHEHVTAAQLERYAQGRMTEPEREPVDRQLEACETCLTRFMAVLERDAKTMDAGQPDLERLEGRVVARLLEERQPEREVRQASEKKKAPAQAKSSRRASWLQHPAFHYTVAASITLLLLGSGTFAAFSQRMAERDSWESRTHRPVADSPVTGQAESWSERMVSQTGSWLDGLQELRFK